MTKSVLALRDLPIWRRVNERAGFILLVSLTSLDEDLRKIMEPGASSFASRLSMLKTFKEAGCTVGVLAMPFLPGLSDDDDSIRKLYTACSDSGVDYVMPGGLTLRPGRQKDFYMKALAAVRPDLVEATLRLFCENRNSGAALSTMTRAFTKRLSIIGREFRMPWLLPHKAFATILPPHDMLRVLYRDMLELYNEKGIETTALRVSAEAYDTWLLSLRRYFRRRRNLNKNWLHERFEEAAHDGELVEVLHNSRLSKFTAAVIQDDARLNYLTLKLE